MDENFGQQIEITTHIVSAIVIALLFPLWVQVPLIAYATYSYRPLKLVVKGVSKRFGENPYFRDAIKVLFESLETLRNRERK